MESTWKKVLLERANQYEHALREKLLAVGINPECKKWNRQIMLMRESFMDGARWKHDCEETTRMAFRNLGLRN